jgi:hypothetical protein
MKQEKQIVIQIVVVVVALFWLVAGILGYEWFK